eukprot:595781-Alexandrium_andersonii.AAC.1
MQRRRRQQAMGRKGNCSNAKLTEMSVGTTGELKTLTGRFGNKAHRHTHSCELQTNRNWWSRTEVVRNTI